MLSLGDACKWLETKGWILAADPYDHAKLTSILVTASLTSKLSELKSAALAVAFLLEANVTDNMSDILAEAVAAKASKHLEIIADKLSSSAEFIMAGDASRAESTLTLRNTTESLKGVARLLDNTASKLAMAPSPATQNAQPGPQSWASLVKNGSAASRISTQFLTPRPSLQFSMPTALTNREQDRVRQRAIQNAKTVLVLFNKDDGDAPKDYSPEGTA
ncbi:hypothetical protein C0989_011980 [Termitomyces sp. Mn162]|nr:hypothetical protein C0989_011980 [Termitomyces sp. Mn162]